MNNYIKFLALISVFFFSCDVNSSKQKEIKESQDEIKKESVQQKMGNSIIDTTALIKKIPESLKSYISDELSSYKMLDLKYFTRDWYVFYENENLHLPYFCTGDFNGDKVTDYALLLLKDDYQLSLLAFHGKSENEYNHYMIKNFGGQKQESVILDVGLFVQESGKVKGIEGEIVLKNEAIVVSFFERSSSLYYWDNGNYKLFNAGD